MTDKRAAHPRVGNDAAFTLVGTRLARPPFTREPMAAAGTPFAGPAIRRRNDGTAVDGSNRHALSAQPSASSWHGHDGGIGATMASKRDAGRIAEDSTQPSARIPARPPAKEVRHVNATPQRRLEVVARRP